MRARTCTRVRKIRIILTETKRFSSTYSAFKKNASTFDIKRKDVSLQTQGRFSSNASAFWMERKGVFFTNKNKMKYYTEKGIKKEFRWTPTFVNLKSNTMKNTVQKYLFYLKQQNTRLKKNALQHTLTTRTKYSKQLTEFIK